ncbi:MAG TPA: hypothetical protein VFT50_07725 [Baekduia sp.]|nr:hypothetical protein [Baekduia sp.]
MFVRAARVGHAEVEEIVPSAHCVHRFRQRMPVRDPGIDEVERALLAALEDADVSRWPPAWAVSDRPARMWAVAADVAFPLEPSDRPGRWVAVTCLRRGGR